MRVLKVKSQKIKEAAGEASGVLKRGGVLVYPTDTCYGLGALISDLRAVEKISRFKGREKEKPFSIIVPSLDWIFKRIANLNQERKDFILEKLPGPYTFVVRIKAEYQKEFNSVSTNGKLGFRYPDNKFSQLLAKKLGLPFTTTSANISNAPPAYSLAEFKRYLKQRPKNLWPDLFVDVGKLQKVKPSKVIDLSTYPFKVLRF